MKRSIIYIYPSLAAFVKKDLSFLSNYYIVKSPSQLWKSKYGLVFRLLKQFAWLCINIPSSKAVIIMFGGHHSLIPSLLGRLFKKPVFIILGGTECVSLSEYNYGSLRKPLLRTIIKWSFANSSCLVPVHESLIQQENKYIGSETNFHQGVKAHFPDMQNQFEVIHNGFEDDGYTPKEKQIDSFIIVAEVSSMDRFYLKGLDKIIMLAKRFKKVSFTIVGIDHKIAKECEFPENVSTYQFLPYHDFKGLLAESEFYIQPSISEGFPNALCEGMLQECIPIGSAVGGMPDIISDTGCILNSISDDEIASTIEMLLALPQERKKELAQKARKRVLDHYGIEKREKAFIELINGYLK